MDNQAAYEFINSKDIREHLRKLDYPLTPVQCAFLVWQSRRHTLKEKHEAWEDIIATIEYAKTKQLRIVMLSAQNEAK